MRELTYIEAIREALWLEMKRDEDIFIAGEDVGVWDGCFGATAGFLKEFGEKRILDMPISESAIMGLGTGSAANGLRPVIEIMIFDFIACGFDQLINQTAKMCYMFGGKIHLPMVIRTVNGGGSSSAAQHSQSLEALISHIPGLKVVMPSTPADAKGLLISAIRDDNPVFFVEHSLLYSHRGEVPEGEYTIPLGKASIKREGDDITIVALSSMLDLALQAANELAKISIQAEVIDPLSLTPLDIETLLESVEKTNHLLIVHEAVQKGGIGAEIAAQISEKAFDFLDAPVRRLGAPFTPVPFNPVLEGAYRPGRQEIINCVKVMLK